MHARPRLAPPLQDILDAELARGNVVAEVAEWPPLCRRLVILTRPFGATYPPQEHVEYRVLDDPHHWQAEYRYQGGVECLACRFEAAPTV